MAWEESAVELSRVSLLFPLFPTALLEIRDVNEDVDCSDALRSMSKEGGGGGE